MTKTAAKIRKISVNARKPIRHTFRSQHYFHISFFVFHLFVIPLRIILQD